MKAVGSPVLIVVRDHDTAATAIRLYPAGQRLGRPFRQPSKSFDRLAKTPPWIFDTGTNTGWTGGPTLPGMKRALPLGLLMALALPATALADTFDAAGNGKLPDTVGINSIWVIVAAMVVMFMQAGFAFLEIGFSRGKNAGTVVAKILTNFSIAGIMYWAVGFAFAFGSGDIIGHTGWFLQSFGDPQKAFPIMGLSDATIEAKWFFQFVFCAVSLAIVWGTTLERIKFGVYVIYGVVFAGFIYPIASHWVFGGGWLQSNLGMQDFAGSTAVHLIGATGALAVLLHLGPRKGKYGADGKPRAIPGHNMPLFGLGILILWLGWFGFNPGSTLNAIDGRFTEVVLVTQLAACAGVLSALVTARLRMGTLDIGMAGNGAIAALVAITAPSGYVSPWAAIPIGAVAGVIVVLGVLAIDKRLDDPVGALSAHGLAGIWGTLSCGLFTNPDLAKYNAVGHEGFVYSGSLHQLGTQALGVAVVFAFVLVVSYGVFAVIKATYGLRVSAEEEEAGLDISEHGMYGYPEQFIPTPELVGYGAAPASALRSASPTPTTQEVPA
jgi:ammonium transporter, Amt family